MKTHLAHSQLNARGIDMSLSTDRIERDGAEVWETVIVCNGTTSAPFRSESPIDAVLAHHHIALTLIDDDHDADAAARIFVRDTLGLMLKRNASPPPSGRHPHRHLRLVPAAPNGVIPETDGRDGNTIPAPKGAA